MGDILSTFHCAIIDYEPPGVRLKIGALVWDDACRRLCLALRHDWRSVVRPEDIEYLEALGQMMVRIEAEESVAGAIRFFEDSLSNILRMRTPETVLAESMEVAASEAEQTL